VSSSLSLERSMHLMAYSLVGVEVCVPALTVEKAPVPSTLPNSYNSPKCLPDLESGWGHASSIVDILCLFVG